MDYLLKDRMTRLPAAVGQRLDEKRLRDEKRRTEEQTARSRRAAAAGARIGADGDLGLEPENARDRLFRRDRPAVWFARRGQFFRDHRRLFRARSIAEDRAAVQSAMTSRVQTRAPITTSTFACSGPTAACIGSPPKGACTAMRRAASDADGRRSHGHHRARAHGAGSQPAAGAAAHVSRLTTMGELVSELAHELNQPLYAIANFSEACLNLAHEMQPAAQRIDLLEWLEQISEQSQRAGEIIRRVYGFVRKTPAQTQAGRHQPLWCTTVCGCCKSMSATKTWRCAWS